MVEHAAVPKRVTDVTAANATQTTVGLAWTLPEQGEGVNVSAVVVDGRWRMTRMLPGARRHLLPTPRRIR